MIKSLWLSLICFFPACILFANNAYLIVQSISDGAFANFGSQKIVALKKANFIPQNIRISVRPNSGIETVSSGFQCRFGAESTFKTNIEGVELFKGSMLVRANNLENKIKILQLQNSVDLRGIGSCFIEVQESGGFKFVGLTGKIKVSQIESGKSINLIPGSLIFSKPKGDGFSNPLNINLLELINSSFLIRGFINSKSYVKALESTALAQADIVISHYGAEVGESTRKGSFEVVPLNERPVTDTNNLSNNMNATFVDDPLTELLGRKPKRMTITLPEELNNSSHEIVLPSINIPEINDIPSTFFRRFEPKAK